MSYLSMEESCNQNVPSFYQMWKIKHIGAHGGDIYEGKEYHLVKVNIFHKGKLFLKGEADSLALVGDELQKFKLDVWNEAIVDGKIAFSDLTVFWQDEDKQWRLTF